MTSCCPMRKKNSKKITDGFKQNQFDEISQNVIDDINFLDKDKLEKSKIILKKINQSRNISLDDEGEILIDEKSTNIPASTFLYALQQTSSKLLHDHYEVLNYLNLAPHLTCNTYAKKFIKVQKEQKLRQFSDGKASEQKPAVERAEKQRLLALMRKASQTQRKKSKRQQAGKLHSVEIKKLNNVYIKGKAAFGSVTNIKKESGLSQKKIEKFLQSKNSYTKYRQFRKNFPRLKVVAYRINEIWSMDVAYMDKISKHNNGVKYLLVAVDV